MSGITADQILTKHWDEDLLYGVSFANLLDSGETLTGTPTVTEQTTSVLTISGAAVNTAAFTDGDGNTVAIGEGVQFRVEDDSDNSNAGSTYEILVKCATTDSNERVVLVKLYVGG